MNLLHMKYAVEIAETSSLNKAAERLFVGQPTLSRAMKELESSLGVTIFDRSAKGMFLTPDGEVFIHYAKMVLKQVDSIQDMFSKEAEKKRRFSISVPRASYISDAFTRFSTQLDNSALAEVYYKETNSMRVIKNVVQGEYNLGILRYREAYDKYYRAMLQEKGLDHTLITEFQYLLLMSAHNPLAKQDEVAYDDLADYIEIAHADPYVPSLPTAEVKKEELPDRSRRRIFVFERASQFELLSHNPETYMWASPVPASTLQRYGLVHKDCGENHRVYKDVLIHRKDYHLSELDCRFIEQLVQSKREIIG